MKKVIPITQPSYFHRKDPIIQEHIVRCIAAAILKHHIAELFEVTEGVDKRIRRIFRLNMIKAPAEVKTYEAYDNFWKDDHRLDLEKMKARIIQASEELEEEDDNSWRISRRDRFADLSMESHLEETRGNGR